MNETGTPNTAARKTAALAVAVVICILALTWARAYYLQRSHFLEAESYRQAGNWKLAIREYDTAMHFYTPWSSYVGRSAQRLWEIGDMFEKKGEYWWARTAYASIRSSFYASRSFYTPGRDWIEKCNEKIATLNALMLLEKGEITKAEFLDQTEKQLAVLQTDNTPSVPWSILAMVGFLGWTVSAVFLIFRGFDRTGRLRTKSALVWLVAFLAFIVLWISALFLA